MSGRFFKTLSNVKEMASGGLMTYSQFKSSRQNSMNGSSSARERGGGADQPNQEGEFEQVRSLTNKKTMAKTKT